MANKRRYARWPSQFYRTGYLLALFFCSLAIGGAIASASELNPLVAFYVAMGTVFCGNMMLLAAHEFGHAAASAMMGWRVSLIVVGPIAIKTHPLRIKFGTPMMGGSFSGATWPVPPSLRPDLRARWIVIFAGGPLANMLIGGSGWLAAEVLPISGIAKVIVLSFSALSAAKGVLNLIPFNTPAGGRSDGGAILDLLRGANPERRGVILQTYARMIAGERPRLWSDHLVAALSANLEESSGEYESMLLYAHYLDRADFATARSLLDRALKRSGPVESLLVEDAFISAYSDQDYARSEALLGRVRTKRYRRSTRYFQVQAILAFAKNDMREGERQIWLARNALRKMAVTTEADWETIQRIASRFAVAPSGAVANPA